MSTFTLAPKREVEPDETPEQRGLGETLLLDNARWYIRIRWVLVALSGLYGLVCMLAHDVLRNVHVVPTVLWPWAVAGILILTNAVFSLLVRRLHAGSPRRSIVRHLWLQIVGDLALLTAVVHFVGSTSTLIAFVYLFHIALACIAFPRRASLTVTLLACGLYLACVSMEIIGIIPPAGVLATTDCACQEGTGLRLLFAGSAVAIWLVIWHLVSTLSAAVHRRDEQLDTANRRILKADREQNRQVLRTTHDLKSPFSGIETSIQALRVSHWKEIPEPVQAIIERIERRCERIRRRISDILLLGELRSEITSRELLAPIDLQALVHEVGNTLSRDADDKKVTLQLHAQPATVFGDRRQFTILLCNLASNAISYSRTGGTVTIDCAETGAEAHVRVSDSGIGIRADALPHIFEDYFRTREASEFNKLSTGLGLAIVKRIAGRFGCGISVESEEGKGTTFDVTIPKLKAQEDQGGQRIVAKIRIIDDDVDHAQDLADVLAKAGHTVSTSHRVEGAVEDLIANKPDLLVLDVMFPEDPSAGMTLAIRIRKQTELQDLPVILLTGVNQEFPLDLSNKDIDPKWLPIQEFMEKPVNAEELLRKINALLQRRV